MADTKMSDDHSHKADWAEELAADDQPDLATQLPAPKITKNKDGSETIVTITLNEKGQKVKTTQRIKKTLKRYTERAGVAERRKWEKFGAEKGRASGPHPDTTTVGENIILRLTSSFKTGAAAAAAAQQESAEDTRKTEALRKMQIKCRICSGDHFTTKCPFKDTMAPEGGDDADDGLGAGGAGGLGDAGEVGADGLKSSYVPPHMRKGGSAMVSDRMADKNDRDDLATLRVTNISDQAVEDELWQIFGRFGHVSRVFLAKDRITGLPKGFAFISYASREDALKAKNSLEGYGLHHLILNIDFATKRPEGSGGGADTRARM